MTCSGIFFYVRNVRTNSIWKASYDFRDKDSSRYEIVFAEDKTKIVKTKEQIETETSIIAAENPGIEIRSIKLKNNSNQEEVIEVSSIFEPVLARKEDDIAHPAFNNLFLKYDLSEDGDLLVKRNKRGSTREMFLACNMFVENGDGGELEYEIDLSKAKKEIKNGLPFSKEIGLVVNPCVALKRKIKLKENEEVTLNLVISVSENLDKAKENIKYYSSHENVRREFSISRAKAEEEARYLEMSSQNLRTVQKLLPYIMYQNPMKSMYLKELPKKEYKQSEFWKYGISGDLPILLVQIKSANDVYVVKEMLKAHEYLRVKGIKTDLVILDYEKNIYEQYVKEQIIQEILNMQIGYMQNISGGIFLLNSNEIQDEDLFKVKSSIIIQASKGNVEDIIKDMEEEYKENTRNIGVEKTTIKAIPEFEKIRPNIDFTKLKYYNDYGGFTEDGREYVIRISKSSNVPAPWSNVLANKNFGTVATSNMGGFTWSKNSRLNRISSWINRPENDIPSEIIYLKDLDYGKIWSLNASPAPDDEDYYITHGFGYTKYYHASLGIIQEAEVFVPAQDKIKVNILTFKNVTPEKRKLKLVYYIKPVLGEDETKTDGYIDLSFKDNTIYAKNIYGEGLSDTVYLTASEAISSYTGNKREFIGSRDLSSPEGLDKVELSNENSLGHEGCIAAQIEIELEPYEDKKIVIGLGEEETSEEIESMAIKYRNLENAESELKRVKDYWNSILRKIQVKTPMESTNFMLNGWAMYQTIVCRLYARSGYYQSGGAFGFRDQLQDALSTKFLQENMLKEQILKHSMHQFEEGDVEHWWHDETKRGIRTRFSDDLLWLVYSVCEYIEFTGDYSILDEETPYIKGNLLNINEDEKYDLYIQSEKIESIYNHCIRAIEKSLDFGENGLPKIGSGDWNDGLSLVRKQGEAEKVYGWAFSYIVYLIDLTRYVKHAEKKII